MRIKAVIIRIFKEMLRDKRTLVLMFVAPLLILTLMYFLFNGNVGNPKLGTFDLSESVIKELKQADIDVIEYEQADKQVIIEDNLDGFLFENKLIVQNSDVSAAKLLQMKVNQVLLSLSKEQVMAENPQLALLMKQPEIEVDYVYGDKDTEFFDILSPILIGFFVFFFVFLISGIGLLKERTTGTLERLLSTPIRRGEIVTSYLIGFGLFAIIQTFIIVLYAVNVLDIVLVGSIWNVFLINFILALVALSLGILLSTFANSEFQMVQFIPLVIIPQVFFSGIFPLENMDEWLQWISKIMPLYYGADALKSVMYQGLGLKQIYSNLLVLIGYALVFIWLNVITLKKYRRL